MRYSNQSSLLGGPQAPPSNNGMAQNVGANYNQYSNPAYNPNFSPGGKAPVYIGNPNSSVGILPNGPYNYGGQVWNWGTQPQPGIIIGAPQQQQSGRVAQALGMAGVAAPVIDRLNQIAASMMQQASQQAAQATPDQAANIASQMLDSINREARKLMNDQQYGIWLQVNRPQ